MYKPLFNTLIFLQIAFGWRNEIHALQTQNNGLDRAERLFAEKLYMDAYPLYENILNTNQDSKQSIQISHRLASCYLELHEEQKALAILSKLKEADPERDYLLAVTLRHLNKNEEALKLLELSSSENKSPEIQLEKGLNNFSLDAPLNAIPYFESILWDPSNPHLYYTAQLYLSRIYLKLANYPKAQIILADLKTILPKDNALQPELKYLQGLSFFLNKQYLNASSSFEELMTNEGIENSLWYKETLYYLSLSYLKQAEASELTETIQSSLLNKAEESLLKVLVVSQNEQLYLALGEVYTAQIRLIKEKKAYVKAQALLSQESLFTSQEGKSKALLLQAETAPSYIERAHFYNKLTQNENQKSLFYAQGWFLKGLNEYEESLKIKEKGEDPKQLLTVSAQSFEKAYPLLQQIDSDKALLALKYQALANYQQGSSPQIMQAWILLKDASQKIATFPNDSNPQELFYLAAIIGKDLLDRGEPIPFEEIEQLLLEGFKLSPNSTGAETLLKTLGALYWDHDLILKSDTAWQQLIDQFPHSPLKSEALFWRGKCAEKLKDSEKMKLFYKELFVRDPKSPFAPTAYFNYYPIREYMQGSRKAIKHLQGMPEIFPNHPLLITANYLIGLDYKKDHLTDGNKIVHHKDYINAIHAFQQSESLYDQLARQELIPKSEVAYFLQIRYRANLERALANLSIANESQGAKRRIYLEYTEEVLKQVIDDLHQVHSKKPFVDEESYSPLLEEAEFKLAALYYHENKSKEAEELFNHIIEHHKNSKKSYFLSRFWYEKGKWAQKHLHYNDALGYFLKAENSFDYLNPDEKLDLWIQQSLCHKELKQLDDSMRILSKVVNSEDISNLRIKAMFLRADIYELEGKPELAIKQLEAIVKKGGDWSVTAKEKLNVLLLQMK